MPRPDEPTYTQRLASAILGEPVMPWLERRRADGQTFVDLAESLKTATRGAVALTHAGIAYWFEREKTAAAARAAAPTEEGTG